MSINHKNTTPLYLQIAEIIKDKIQSGKFKVGDQINSQNELSKQYNVSLITIKKALSILSEDGYLYSRMGKGTFVESRSALLDLKKHRSIGIVLENLQSPFFSQIIQNIEDEAYKKGYNILVSNTSGDRKKEKKLIQHFRQIGVSGLIIAFMTDEFRANRSLRELNKDNYPYISVSYVYDEDIYMVGADHVYGAKMATSYLISLGYRSIGYLNAIKGNMLGNVRLEGYKKALSEHKIPFNPIYVYHMKWDGEFNDFNSGYKFGNDYDQLMDKPEAIFCYNDLSALGFQQCLIEKGYKIPGDVAIVGFDDIERSSYASVPLTTIHQPTSEIGKKAINALICRIEGKKNPVRTILPPKLIIRDSCGGNKLPIRQPINLSF